MFYPALCVTIAALLYMKVFRGFFRLSTGQSYKAKNGQIIEIRSQIMMGRHRVYIGSNNYRYFANGERVGDRGIWNQDRLYEFA